MVCYFFQPAPVSLMFLCRATANVAGHGQYNVHEEHSRRLSLRSLPKSDKVRFIQHGLSRTVFEQTRMHTVPTVGLLDTLQNVALLIYPFTHTYTHIESFGQSEIYSARPVTDGFEQTRMHTVPTT